MNSVKVTPQIKAPGLRKTPTIEDLESVCWYQVDDTVEHELYKTKNGRRYFLRVSRGELKELTKAQAIEDWARGSAPWEFENIIRDAVRLYYRSPRK